jgi:hypothetical protein
MPLDPINPTGVFTAWPTPVDASAGAGIAEVLAQDPGDTNPPIIFEPGPVLSGDSTIIWIIASGGVNWGGAQVYVSLDGTTYAPIGAIGPGSAQGLLSDTFPSGSDPDTANTLSVDLTMSRGTIVAGTSADADFMIPTLAYCDTELIAFSAATLTSTYNYDLDTYIRRGCYDTTIASHASGTQFAWIRSPFSYEYPSSLIGSTIYFKFPAFNKLGANLQDLADCVAYPYTLTGIGKPSANLALGLWHLGCDRATIAALPACTYNNGASGVGATLTGNANGALVVDGGGILSDRVLVKDQVSLVENGAFILTVVGDAGTAFVLTRVTDYDEDYEIAKRGAAFPILGGDTLVGSIWAYDGIPEPFVVGTDDIPFIRLGGLAPGVGVPIDVLVSVIDEMTNAEMLLAPTIIPACSFPSGAVGSYGNADVAATGSTTVAFKKNGTNFATFVWSAAGQVATVTIASTTSFDGTSDKLSCEGPATADATLAEVGIRLAGTRT